MLKDSTHAKQYELLEEFVPDIIRSIRRDLRQDHLKQDQEFLKTHFGSKNPNKLKTEDMAPVYAPLLKEGKEEYWEFFTDRWIMKHTDIYDFFEAELSKVAEDFTELEELDGDFSRRLVDGAVRSFGAVNTLIFSALNSVVFPESVYADLKKMAAREKQ